MEDSGSLLDEATWAKLGDIRYLQFREKMRTSSDKRRRVLQLIKDRLHLTRENPSLLKSWISMLAFEDVPEFASLTGIDVDLVLQNLMFRMKEIEENFNYNHLAQSLEAVEKVLCLLLEKITRERIVKSKSTDSILQCCHAVHRSSRSFVKLVPQYKVAVVSFQLLLQTVEIQHAALSQDGEEAEEPKKQLLDKIRVLQKEFCEWRDELLKKPLVQRDASSFTYPRELQMWSDLFGIEISIPEVSNCWEGALDRGLRSRVSQMSDFQKVSVCYLKETADVVEKSHGKVQTCFKDSCLAAIKNLCQAKQEGSVLAQLFDKHLSSPIISFFIVESAIRFEEDWVACLLDPQSAISFLLAQEVNWSQLKLDEAAESLISSCRSSLSSLIHSLCQGDLLLGQLKTILSYKAQFVKLYHKHKAHSQEHSISVGVSELLLQREKDLEALDEQKSHMSILINMLGKISDVISVPDSARLEKLIKTNLLDKPLNSLVEVQSGFCKEDADKTKTRRVLFYTVNQLAQDMALEMSSAKNSNIVLSLWQQAATGLVNGKNDSEPLSLDFSELHHHIWRPCFHNFLNLGGRIASGEACFDEVNQILEWCGDHGEEDSLRTELVLLAGLLRLDSDQNWPEHRLSQIMEYKLLYDTAETAKVILKIKHRLELKGDFSEIQNLTEVKDDAYKQCTLGSLSDDLIQTSRMLASVKKRHRACLEAFLQSTSLISWVKSQIETLKDLKVFMELASISAGENDADIDRLASFETVVMGYAPFLYSLQKTAGLKEFMDHAKQVWNASDKDDKLSDKLIDSSRWLDWLKGLRETHGSVEQSSLSLATAINTGGVYHVGWPDPFSGHISLDSTFCIKVWKDKQAKTFRLEELLELQNKLMLISSKGEHGREQVNKFTQVFEEVQRIARIFLQFCSSGNILFQNWEAEITCNAREQPCILLTFHLLDRRIEFRGELVEELQKLCHILEKIQKEWCSHLTKMRFRYCDLNYYTSEQILYLCQWVHRVHANSTNVPQKLWLLLMAVKPNCNLDDIREAFEQSAQTVAEDDDEDDDDIDLSQLFSFQEDEDDSKCLETLWLHLQQNMSKYLTNHLDVETLGKFLAALSATDEMCISRILPSALQVGRPNLVQCRPAELISTTLSFYTESPECRLPSTDEVLMCQEDTTEEEVKIFLYRCLGTQSSVRNHKKIYTLVDPGSLGYDVSVALVECFETLEKAAGLHYHLVIVCPLNQDRYVPSFFNNYKVQRGLGISAEKNKNYLRHHFHVPGEVPTHSKVYPRDLSVWMIASHRPAVGKSLYIKRLHQRFKQVFPRANCVRVRLINPSVDMDEFVQTLSRRLAPFREQDPVLLHIDAAAVRHGLEEFLFKLLVLGCINDTKGNLWRRNPSHLVAIETLFQGQNSFRNQTETNHGFLCLLPTILCRSPKDVTSLYVKRHLERNKPLDPLMDYKMFESEHIQRPYQYLTRFNKNQSLDRFKYQKHSVEGNPVDCLHHLLENCGLKDPSWAELQHFCVFLNYQLKDCEESLFCDPDFLEDNLLGFKDFIVKFMVNMARDFASPSVDISDQSPSFLSEDDIISKLMIRKRWENESHPYIFFNADHLTMSFLGFHVIEHAKILNAVDSTSGKVIVANVMSKELFLGIERQKINLTEDFDRLSREDKIQRISLVVGAKKGWIKGNFDPDPTYELTADNVMKMLAIHMRFRCMIPVIIMGETGCGKTRLVRFLCDLQREGRDVENMKLVKVHGGTTAQTIYTKVCEAEQLAWKNRKKFNLDTVLFFDEANSTEAIFAIKEVLCDKSVEGRPFLKYSGLKIIAACNPYRRHTPEMINRLERAGLGYRVRAEETEDRLGKVPMRQLVYRVHPLPPSMMPLVWDFGQLSDLTELSYINQIVQKHIKDNRLPLSCHEVIADVLSVSQKYMREQADECSFVSLRDVERSMRVLLWFYQHRHLISHDGLIEPIKMTLKCLVLAVGVCYYPSLEHKSPYLDAVSGYFPQPLDSAEALEREITSCQDLFLKNIETRGTIAKNLALKENVFLMVICIELRIPLFLVGKPGSSKSLAKTIVADAMQRQASNSELFQKLKEVHMVSFQCSPHSSPEGIIGTFRNCSRFQKDKNLKEYVSVVVLDEIGLAEDSPKMPLKTLHPLLEDGCIDSDMSPEPHMKVGFVGISNWALDPAKMNRGIFVSRWDPNEKELVETAEGICSSSKNVLLKIKHLLPKLASGFLSICKSDSEQFFGLRDFYSLIKMIFATVKDTNKDPSDNEMAEAVLRNFSGQRADFNPLEPFRDIFMNYQEIQMPSTLKMIEQNLSHCSDKECRYLLLLTTNNAALYIIQQHIFSKVNRTCPEIVFGSGFPKDQEYGQICRNVSRIKACMETGRTVILLNLLNLYESLYDALNQYYVYFSGQQYVDLGLGSHRVKCRVHKDFRLVVVEDQEKVYKTFPVPLKNRLEKHKVFRSTDLLSWQHRVLDKLKQWTEEFAKSSEGHFSPSDSFVGFHGDACASALLQALDKMQTHECNDKTQICPKEGEDAVDEGTGRAVVDIEDDFHDHVPRDYVESSTTAKEEQAYEMAKSFLLNCATPDSVLRLKYSEIGTSEKEELQRSYFLHQSHQSLRDLLESHLNSTDKYKSRFLEVTTFSSLLTRADIRSLGRALGLSLDRILLVSLHQFDTEASFCSKIRSFLRESSSSLHILLVQIDMEESLCRNELIASGKYCTMNEIMSSNSDVCNCSCVFLTKLSRIGEQCIANGNKYVGFQGGMWLSTHIDDLRDSDDMSFDARQFCGKPISSLISQAIQSDASDSEKLSSEELESKMGSSLSLNSLSLIRSCTQKAVSLLRDSSVKNSRSLERMNILFGLFGDEPGPIAARFQDILLRRLVPALVQWEDLVLNAKDWAYKEASNREALQEGGTLRHTLWRKLQAVCTPSLAQMLEVLDRDCNLHLLYGEGLSQGLSHFWLDVFQDRLLDLSLTLNASPSEQELDVKYHLFVGEEERPCSAPFSWRIRTCCQSLWEESEFLQGCERGNKARIQQFVSAVSGCGLGNYVEKLSESEKNELGQRYLTDYVLLSFKIHSDEMLEVFRSAVLGCVFALQKELSVNPHLSFPWIQAAAQVYSPRLETLSHALQLNPLLVRMVHHQRSGMEDVDMCEDILAVGISVEETKCLPLTSISQCRDFLHKVEQLQPCVERVFNSKYCSLCSPRHLKHLDAIKSVWQWMLLVAAFIEHVVIKMKEGDEKMEAITLHHCCQIQGLMENQPDLRSTDNLHQIIRILNDYHEESISHELRFGMKCAVCLSDLSEPAALPCEHVFCVSCLRRSIQEDTPFCPLCRAPLPGNFLPTASSTIDLALEQHREMRERCNAFFLEVVSRFCLTDGQEPVEDLVELLLSLLISAQGDVYKTRALTPFLECVDQSPVVRSVLPKLLLHHSFKLVKKHIRMYLENLENKLLDAEDRTELYRLFVNCFQDLLLSCGLNESTRPGKRAGGVTEDSSFLSRVARRQTSSRQDDPAEFLLSMARLRVCLDAVARILVRVLAQQDDEHEEAELKQVAQVKAVCEYADHDWFRVYLLRSLNRQGGTDLLRALIHSPEYHWIFPSQILRHHQLIGTEVDRVLCCGPSYRSLRDAVGEVLLGGRVDPLNQPLQAANVSGPVLLTLAVFRQVTSRFYSPEGKRHPQAQEVVLLGEFVRQTLSGHVRDLCASLLANQIGGPGSFLSVSADVPARRRVLLELLVHASAVFFSGKELLRPLHVIASRPQSMSEAFLPTMPDNYTSEAQQWLGGEKLTMYLCANGHPSFVGNCGKPMDLAKCDTCGVPIGGQNHNPVLGFTRAQGNLNRDLTQTGHVLGRAVNRSEAPNRTLTLAQSCVLRLCLHLAMMQGTIHYPQGVSSMISPTVHNVAGFLWEHLEKDMEVLGKTLDLNMDDTTIVLHLIFERFLQTSSGAGMNLSSRRSRERWESAVCTYVISPVLMNLSRMLARAQDLMAADRLTDSPLMKLLRGDPRDILPLPSDCPTHHSAFWSLSPVLTMESFSQQIDQAQTPLLTLYVNKVKCVRQLIHLPSLASLLSELVSVFPPGFHTRLSITSLLCSLPSVHQKKWLSERVGIFVEVWNRLRMEISGLSEELCETDLSMESSGQFLLASRRGAGSCLHAVVDLLSETHNSLVRESRKLCHHNPSDYNVPVMALSESQIALCHPEKDFLPLVLANCHYTLEKGQQTVSFCDHQAIERELSRRYFAGKPRIKTDTDKYLRRQHQNFSEVLEEVRAKITQEPLKASVLASMRSVLRSFTDVCDALHAVEIGLRFLGKTGGDGHVRLLVYLTDSLKMQKHISSSVAEALKENRLRHCTSTWQLLSCWKSQQMMKKGQDPFQRLSEDFRKSLTSEERRLVRVFLTVTDTDVLSLELHEILQLQTSSSVEDGFAAHWDFRTTMEIHLEKKNIPSIPGLDDLSDEITLAKAIEIWKLAVEFKQS